MLAGSTRRISLGAPAGASISSPSEGEEGPEMEGTLRRARRPVVRGAQPRLALLDPLHAGDGGEIDWLLPDVGIEEEQHLVHGRRRRAQKTEVMGVRIWREDQELIRGARA